MKLGAIFDDPVVGEYSVEFGSSENRYTCPDGSPYAARLTLPRFQWERMGSPSEIFCVIKPVSDVELPDQNIWCEPNTGGTEMGIGPKLDYAIGRTVLASSKGTNGELRISIDGGIQIIVEGFSGEPQHPDLVGLIFMRPIYSSSETRMQFGRVSGISGSVEARVEKAAEISAIPTEYRIIDPRFSTDKAHYPQRRDVEETVLPVDPSPERVAEAPGSHAEASEEAEADLTHGGGEETAQGE